MRKLSNRELAHVAAMLGMLVIGVRCGPEVQQDSGDAHFTTQNALMVAERRALQLCVELDPALEGQSEQLLESLEQDVAALAEAHPDWQSAGFGRAPVRVQRGCPGTAMPSGRMQSKGARLGPGLTSRPSPFRTFVHILGEAKAQEVLGDEPAVRAHAELMRVEDHMAAEVSTSLVIRASALGTEAFRQTWLPTGVGLKTLGGPAAVSPDSVK
ncbi:hypothetical protein [Archangium sp.]|uniref:hypothetical protein n=1 Tax=Archangium sp. TaxID=1872627 RepID=UPI002D67AFB4|nr:hypothetical protein [Archangium sp.]HYO51655.1 hypothetical protein [Archangium sp.]